MGQVWLTFRQIERDIQRHYKIDWPLQRPLLWANISTDNLNIVDSLGEGLLLANMSPDHRTYFAATTEDGHDRLKSLLTSNGDPYHEIRQVQGKKKVARNLFEFLTLGRIIPDVVSTLLASTASREVLEAVFEHYKFFRENFFIFPFLVARNEPIGWMEQLTQFSDPKSQRMILRHVIETARCVMLTQWDLGIDFVSDKMSNSELEQVVKKIASEHSMQLEVSNTPLHNTGT